MRYLYLSLACLLVGLLCFMAVSSPRTAPVRVVDVKADISYEGDRPLMPERDLVNELKALGFRPIGQSVDSLSTMAIESQLIRNGLFSHIDLYTTPGGVLHVSMLQREPLFTLLTPQGNYFVCKDQTVVPIARSEDYYTTFLPVSGSISVEKASHELYPLMQLILSDPLWRDLFIHIYVDPLRGVIATPRASNTEIILGTGSNWEEKLDNLRLFIEQVIPIFGWNSFISVHLEYKDQIVTVPSEEGALQRP
ncbi:cell division protein FtsQ/DivIB [Porphyromonas asaccharolytica]|uniref:cell division protein FtsQ/DivIB n=1 Tax=Porphyromonas asaccharolytica TaxID=28123 RepID=UPI0001EB286B|nr:hypothetical protein [Porphyromonas asaccharolytica]EFR34243.1 hypothetical protein HMPREF9294_0361 [Porphyromonas asaccharolytica PR426713P-I]